MLATLLVFQIAYQLPGCKGRPAPLLLWFPPHLSALVSDRDQAHLRVWCLSEERGRFFARLLSKVLYLGQALGATRTHIRHENRQIWTLEISFQNYIGLWISLSYYFQVHLCCFLVFVIYLKQLLLILNYNHINLLMKVASASGYGP